jgi:hypothetical protein
MTKSLLAVALVSAALATASAQSDGWITIFDGKTLDGWKASENPSTFSVKDGQLVVDGPRAHLYYVGPVANHNFTNFEWKADVMTTPGSNSGMYIHTEFQETGWPAKGYEVQVNNSHTDWRRTGGLYAIVDVKEPPAKDNEWFTQHITVQGKHITIRVNGKVTSEYTEPAGVERPAEMAGRKLGSGTVAIQGHDPKSKVFYKNIQIKVLP